MIIAIIAIAFLSLGIFMGVIFGPAWGDSFRATNWRRELDNAFSDGYRAHRDEMERR